MPTKNVPTKNFARIALILLAAAPFLSSCGTECKATGAGIWDCAGGADLELSFDAVAIGTRLGRGGFQCTSGSGDTADLEPMECLLDSTTGQGVLFLSLEFDDDVMPLGPTSEGCRHTLRLALPLRGDGVKPGAAFDLAAPGLAHEIVAEVTPVAPGGPGECAAPVRGIAYRVVAGTANVLATGPRGWSFEGSLVLERTDTDGLAAQAPAAITITSFDHTCVPAEAEFC